MHEEVSWWIKSSLEEYRISGRFNLPEWDIVSLTSPLAWKLYWIEFRQRVLPPTFDFLSTQLVMQCFHQYLLMICSKETFLHLTQHPPRRAVAIASREPDRIKAGMEVFVVSLWANIVFFAANYTVSQIGTLYHYYVWRRRVARSGAQTYDQDRFMEDLTTDSWKIFSMNIMCYFYSSVGAGLGTIFSPGFGTLLGTGLGDRWAARQPPLEPPRRVFQFLYNQFQGIFGEFMTFRSSTWGGAKPGTEKGSSHVETDELMCGCCQTTSFSSDPNSRDRAPISSRSCSHTICKSCVEQCHVAFMELNRNYISSIRCPLCNATGAFSARDPLVNRSLCSAIAALERSASTKNLPHKDL